MKSILFLIILSSTQLIVGQTAPKATIGVTVTNMNMKPIANEVVLFIGQKSRRKISGQTNAQGKFEIDLPSSETYDIQLSTIGDEIEYNTLEIPTLPEGSEFQKMEIQIAYELPTTYTLSNLQFDAGKATIKGSSYKSLDQLIEFLKRKKVTKIQIAGHTDSDGNNDTNLKLSQNRAMNVKRYLIKKGIQPGRVETIGYGETRPIALNSTAVGKAANRRTEVHIL